MVIQCDALFSFCVYFTACWRGSCIRLTKLPSGCELRWTYLPSLRYNPHLGTISHSTSLHMAHIRNFRKSQILLFDLSLLIPVIHPCTAETAKFDERSSLCNSKLTYAEQFHWNAKMSLCRATRICPTLCPVFHKRKLIT